MIVIQMINKLGDIWIDPESEGELSDQDYIELIHEDIGQFLDGAYFRVIRDDNPPPANGTRSPLSLSLEKNGIKSCPIQGGIPSGWKGRNDGQ